MVKTSDSTVGALGSPVLLRAPKRRHWVASGTCTMSHAPVFRLVRLAPASHLLDKGRVVVDVDLAVAIEIGTVEVLWSPATVVLDHGRVVVDVDLAIPVD